MVTEYVALRHCLRRRGRKTQEKLCDRQHSTTNPRPNRFPASASRTIASSTQPCQAPCEARRAQGQSRGLLPQFSADGAHSLGVAHAHRTSATNARTALIERADGAHRTRGRRSSNARTPNVIVGHAARSSLTNPSAAPAASTHAKRLEREPREQTTRSWPSDSLIPTRPCPIRAYSSFTAACSSRSPARKMQGPNPLVQARSGHRAAPTN
jgi:hypothetical protein